MGVARNIPSRKRVVILGSTGCVGRKTLEVIRRYPERFEVVALVAARDVEGLAAQSRIFSPRCVALAHERHARRFLREIGTHPSPRIFTGEAGIAEILEGEEIDLVVSAIPGIAGLWPTLSAARLGYDIAIACKEAIVAGGHLLVECVRKHGGRLIPLDSEHNAIFRLLAYDPTPPRRIVLTASGGPFLHREDLHGVTPEEAVRHPIWRMGPKISVDCATLMNKGLEIIEA
ncbi:MAG: 1-deoxy-D-xylulose-5-phosphate reductoisomerase, partial [Deltaproteobacteria bacterium]